MNSFELYSNIRNHIEKNFNDLRNRKIVIYPYGQIGLLVKQILNEQYDLYESYIVDNGLSKYNKSVLSLDACLKYCDNNTVFFLTAANKKNNRELLNNLNKYIRDCHIINVIEPVVINTPEKSNFFSELRELLLVKKINKDCELIRVGRNNDGGYLMLDDFSSCKIAYSFGISDDISWDNDIANKSIDVFQYDPTIFNIPEYNDRFHFFKVGIAGADNFEIHMLTLETILKINGHDNKQNMILKMDVEGAEWECIESTPEDVFNKFDQLVFEMHGITDESNRTKIVSSIKKISRTHQLVWIHGNNYSKAEQADGIIVPDCIEVLYLNRQKYCFESSSCVFPYELDQPNNNRLFDFDMGNWGER